jgi:hypothetical protein
MQATQTFLLLFFSFSIYSQTPFKVEENKIIYDQVFDSIVSNDIARDLLTKLSIDPHINEVTKISEDIITFKIVGLKIDYGKISSLSLPIFSFEPHFASGKILIKENRYKVILSNIHKKAPDLFNSRKLDNYDVELFLSKGEIKKSKHIQKYFEALSKNFTSLFTIKEKTEEQW